MAGRPRRNVEPRPEAPPAPIPDWIQQFMQGMQQQQQMTQQMLHNQQLMMQQMFQTQQNQPPAPFMQPPPENPNQMYFRFQKSNPPGFNGVEGPMQAQYWVDTLEKKFRTLMCSDEQKVLFASDVLSGEAEIWWRNAHEFMVSQGTPITWENFKKMFLDKFFPVAMRLNKEDDFMALKQENMTVSEYAAKFDELSQFYQLAKTAVDEQWKIRRFKKGLRADIAQGFSSFVATSFVALVQQSYIAEEDLKRVYDERKEH